MRTAAKAIESRLRAGVGVLKAPAASELKLLGTAFHELDDALGITSHVIAYPERGAAMLGLDREEKAIRRRLLGRPVLG